MVKPLGQGRGNDCHSNPFCSVSRKLKATFTLLSSYDNESVRPIGDAPVNSREFLYSPYLKSFMRMRPKTAYVPSHTGRVLTPTRTICFARVAVALCPIGGWDSTPVCGILGNQPKFLAKITHYSSEILENSITHIFLKDLL